MATKVRTEPEMRFVAAGEEGEETQLRLGLSLSGGGGGNAGDGDAVIAAGSSSARKRGFLERTTTLTADDAEPPPAKAQIVGWPPVRSYRKNNILTTNNSSNGALIKVSIDGAPYLRKVNLKMYSSYQDLSDALGKMFSSFTIGNYGENGMIDFMNESKLMDHLINGSDYVPTYEDKDGDWMLVGDVPWEMFVESCKRLRIMKGKEAVGLAPRAMEKYGNKKNNDNS